jgi:hypothetical protein
MPPLMIVASISFAISNDLKTPMDERFSAKGTLLSQAIKILMLFDTG